MKRCSKCKSNKSIKDFCRDKSTKDGLIRLCSDCRYQKHKNSYRKKRDYLIKEAVRWNREHPEERRRSAARYRRKNKEKVYRWGRVRKLRTYGLNEETYGDLFNSQGRSCAICEVRSAGKNRRVFSIDHDHKTGKVRGLLCERCNKSIGAFNDDPKLLIEAAKYLMRSEININSVNGGK